MSLEDIVTEHLAPEPGRVPTIMEIWRSPARMTPEECLRAMREYRRRLDTISRGEVLAETTRALLALRGLEEPFHTLHFMYALDYQEEGTPSSLDLLREEADKWIARIENQQHSAILKSATGSQDSSIDYLQEVWGDQLPQILATLTGCGLASTRRWIAGARARPNSAGQIMLLARCAFVLREQGGWTPAEVRDWAEQPLANSQTLLEGIHSPIFILSLPTIIAEAVFAKNGRRLNRQQVFADVLQDIWSSS